MKHMDILLPILAVFLILSGTALGAFITYKFRRQNLDNQEIIKTLNNATNSIVKKSKELNDEILKVSNATHLLSNEIQTITKSSKEVQDELKIASDITKKMMTENKELSKKNKELSEFLINFSTGGDSYPFMTLAFLNDTKPVKTALVVRNEGEFPLYDIRVEYIDLKTRHENIDKLTLFKSYTKASYQILAPEEMKNITMFTEIPNEPEIDYLIKTNTRNGEFKQILIGRKSTEHPDLVSVAFQVAKYNRNLGKYEVIKTAFWKDFPENEKDSVERYFELSLNPSY